MYADDLNIGFHHRGQAGTSFIRCQKMKAQGFHHIQCLLDYIRLCRSHNTTFAKVIRVPMRFAQDLLEIMSNLKIIYLIRDPRAVLYSQGINLKREQLNWTAYIQHKAEALCTEIEEDLRETRRLKTLFPGRVLLVRYENLALDTLEYAKKIYNFTQLHFTRKIERFIRNLHTEASWRNDKEVFGVRRSNVTMVINNWRDKEGSYEAGQVVDKYCGKLYTQLGYYNITSRKQLLSIHTEPVYKERFEIS